MANWVASIASSPNLSSLIWLSSSVYRPAAIARASNVAAANSNGLAKKLPNRFRPLDVSKVQESP